MCDVRIPREVLVYVDSKVFGASHWFNHDVWEGQGAPLLFAVPVRKVYQGEFTLLKVGVSFTAFGNAPSMSRKRTETTCFLHHASFIRYVRVCSASVVVLAGLPPKCIAGSSPFFSV